MNGFNRVVLMGNLTRDPQMRQVQSGTSVAELGLAINDSYRDRDGELVERVCFADITTWGRQAETCGQYLTKGARVLIEGKLELNQWETQDGQRRSKLRVRADRVQFLGRPNGGGNGGEDGVRGEREHAVQSAPNARPADGNGEPF